MKRLIEHVMLRRFYWIVGTVALVVALTFFTLAIGNATGLDPGEQFAWLGAIYLAVGAGLIGGGFIKRKLEKDARELVDANEAQVLRIEAIRAETELTRADTLNREAGGGGRPWVR